MNFSSLFIFFFFTFFFFFFFYISLTVFGAENPPKRGKHFFSVSPGKALWVDFFQKKIIAEMDRHQLALAYDAVVSSGEL